MLTALRQHPLLVRMAEVLIDAIRYIAIVLVALVALAQLVKMISCDGGGPTASDPKSSPHLRGAA
jgi:hypothetical protein